MLNPADGAALNGVNHIWESWDGDAVKRTLEENGLSDSIVAAFVGAGIQGKHFKKLNFCNLMSKLNLSYSDCLEVKNFFVKIGCWPAPFVGNLKIFNDPIHGNIRLNPICLAVIDTPQFQRLRYIKQLGLCYFVYPGAAHNRFEHSLGVCYLAGEFIRTLKANQPELGIDEKDVLCVELAGLCHDLGHGPFSHVFDAKFIPQVVEKPWKHETASRDMFAHIVEEHGLMQGDGIFIKSGLTERDMDFIKELMAGPSNRGNAEWPYKGREKAKAYLYEIVANKRNCIDVDKWDYISRDCHQLGIRNNFDHTRFIKFARVIEVNGEMQICVRDKEIVNLYNMFSTRYILHKNAYQHKVNCALDIMVEQVLIKADKHVRMIGKDGERVAISECIDDMVAYTHLTDNILFKILDTQLPETESHHNRAELEAAKAIIQRIFSRNLFKCIFESQPLNSKILEGELEEKIKEKLIDNCTLIITSGDGFTVKITEKETKLEITYSRKDNSIHTIHINKDHAFDKMTEAEIRQKIIQRCELVISNKDGFFVKIADLDFGMKDENPVEKLNVYSKHKPDEAKHFSKEETSRILAPYIFKEQLVRIYIFERSLQVSDGLNIAWHIWFDERTRYLGPAKQADEQQSAQPKQAGEQQSAQPKQAGEQQSAQSNHAGEQQSAQSKQAGEQQSAQPKQAGEQQSAQSNHAGEQQSAQSKQAGEQQSAQPKQAGEQQSAQPKQAGEQQSAQSNQAGEQQSAQSKQAGEEQSAQSNQAGEQQSAQSKQAGEEQSAQSKQAGEQQSAQSKQAGEEQSAQSKQAGEQQSAQSNQAGEEQSAQSNQAGEQQSAQSKQAGEEQSAQSNQAGEEQSAQSNQAGEQQSAQSKQAGEEQSAQSKQAGEQQSAQSKQAGEEQSAQSKQAGEQQSAQSNQAGEEQSAQSNQAGEQQSAQSKQAGEEQSAQSNQAGEEQSAQSNQAGEQQSAQSKQAGEQQSAQSKQAGEQQSAQSKQAGEQQSAQSKH